jgi:preprotein translocase subunit SecG
MQWLSSALLAIQVISSLAIIALVLLQQGKGADMGSSFGGGSAGSLFGATGAANFLSRCTKWAAIIFFASTIGLAYVSHRPTAPSAVEGGVMQGFETRAVPAAPGSAAVPSGNAVPSVPGSAPAAGGATAVPSVPSTPPAAPAQSPVPAASEAAPAPAVKTPEVKTPEVSKTPEAPAAPAPAEKPVEQGAAGTNAESK